MYLGGKGERGGPGALFPRRAPGIEGGGVRSLGEVELLVAEEFVVFVERSDAFWK